jgi:hypothetical protein
MSSSDPPRDPTRDALAAAYKAIAEGEAIVERARETFDLPKSSGDGDGPLTRAWRRGKFPPRTPQATLTETSEHQPSLVEMAERVVAFERSGRWIAAAMGLAVLRRRYEELDREDLPTDQRTWADFVEKHLQSLVPAERVNDLLGRMLHRNSMLRCVKCGAEARCECSCGRPYVGENQGWAMGVQPTPISEPAKAPTALDRALAAIEADPDRSDRAIAAEIGVDHKTVAKARKSLEDQEIDEMEADSPDDSPVGRVGRDGRRRKLPGKARPLAPIAPPDPDRDLLQEEHPDATTAEQRWRWSAENVAGDAIAMRAFWNKQFGDWHKFEPPTALIKLAHQAVAEWKSLVGDLERRKQDG